MQLPRSFIICNSFDVFHLSSTFPCTSIVQAAKEFETELKKDPDDSSTMPPTESSKSVSGEDEIKKLETSGSKDS